MRFFDCNVRIGRPHKRAWRHLEDANAVRKALSRFEIGRACVAHAIASEASPQDSNADLFRLLDGGDALLPVPCGLPPGSGEVAPSRDFCAEAARRGAAGVMLQPKTHSFSSAEWCCGGLYAAAEARRLPLFLPFGDWPLNEVHDLCGSHPGLRVVLLDLSYGLGRMLPALLESCPSLRLETSGLLAHRQLDWLCSRVGAERFVFGSRLPALSPGQGLAQVLSAGIRDEDKQNIAAVNLERMMSEVIRE